MTTTPTSISFTDLRALADPLRAAAASKLAAAHQVITPGTPEGDVLDALHSSLKDMDDAYIGIFPADVNAPQPSDGGDGNKNP